MEEIVNINKRRLPVVVGQSGSVKKEIEKKCKVSLEIDSHNAEIVISSNNNYFNIYKCKKIIVAISRGFSPEHAFILLNDDYTLEQLHIAEYVGKHKSRMEGIKGRVIGKEGKFKKFVEKKFGCYLAIFGKTVTIICKTKDQEHIVEVIESILNGSKHTTAFKLIKKYTSPLREYKPMSKNRSSSSDIDDISF